MLFSNCFFLLFCIFVCLQDGRFEFKADEPKFFAAVSGLDEGASGLVSPMPGVVNRVEVEPGDTVKKGQTLVVLIAMKMEVCTLFFGFVFPNYQVTIENSN